jgi:hypothetical protein
VSVPQVTPITGLPQVNGWAQVVTHPSRLLTCVLSVSGKNANSVGKTLAEHISHFRVSTSAQLHNALLDVLQSARREECHLQLACILVSEERNIIAAHSGTVFLRRNHRTGQILTSDNDLKIIEGAHVEDDVFVLATRQAVETFPELKNVLHQETESLVTRLVAELHEKENSSLSALAWIENSKETETAALPAAENGSNWLSRLPGIAQAAGVLKTVPLSRIRQNPMLYLRRGMFKVKTAAQKIWRFGHGAFTNPARSSSRNFLLIGCGLILILSAVILWKRHQISAEVQTLQPRLGELQQQLEHTKTLAENEPITARAEARAVLKGLEDLIAASQDKPQALKKLREEYQITQEFLESLSGSENQGALEPFFDLRLAEANFVAKQLAMGESALFALDAEGQKIVALNTQTKQTEQIPLEDIGTGRALAASEETVYVLADGLHSYDLSGESRNHTALKAAGDSDRAGTLLANFTSYLYVVNPESRNIFRYLQEDETLSDPVGWLIDKQGLEFGSIEDIAIDGDVWLTTSEGEVKKYTQGRPQTFAVTDLQTSFDSPLKIATHPDSEYLFILESSRRRLVILRKDGSFLKEIISESFASANALAVSPAENAAFVVSGSLVYRVGL